MARTKGKPGPKPKYGEREEIHVLVPVDDLNYIRSITQNTTEWVIQAVQEKRQRESEAQSAARGRAYRKFFTKSGASLGDIDRLRLQQASERILTEDEQKIVNRLLKQLDLEESEPVELPTPQQSDSIS